MSLSPPTPAPIASVSPGGLLRPEGVMPQSVVDLFFAGQAVPDGFLNFFQQGGFLLL